MVQIYQNEELNDVLFEKESLDEWQQLAQELNMDNQLKFVDATNSPNPYPHINESMERVFTTLCPCKVELKQYDKTPIPLDVMKQIAFSVRENHFQKIEIWYDDKTPDPFVVGISHEFYAYDKKYARLKNADGQEVRTKTIGEMKYYCDLVGFQYENIFETNHNKYLIARWGDEIRPIPELKKLANDRLIEKYGTELKKEIDEKTQALKQIKENTLLYLNGELTESQIKGSRY